MPKYTQTTLENPQKYISEKYRCWIESQSEKFQEIIKLATTSKEKIGSADVSFVELIRIEPNLNDVHVNGTDFFTAQRDAKSALSVQEFLISDDQLLESISKDHNSSSSVEAVASRIKLIRDFEDPVSADILEKKFIDIAKSIGLKPKTINDILNKKNTEDGDVKLPFEVLGYNSERKVLIWNKGHFMAIPVSQLRKDELSLIIGHEFDEKSLKNQIILHAHQKGMIDEEDPIKGGIWNISDKWLVVSGKESLLVNSEESVSLKGPVFQDRIVHLERYSWVDVKKINQKSENLKGTFEKVLKYVSQWGWLHPEMAEYIAAFVMLTPFQQAMSWRPWILLTGPTSCGKSAFFEYVIVQIYGRLVKKIDKATAHSVAQAVGNSSKILILDEFEKNNKIPDILETLKLMNRGGSKTSGTVGKTEFSYNLHHLPWMASIYPPASLRHDESQRNRLIRLDLKKKKKCKPINVLSSTEAKELCVDIISSVLARWGEIQEKASNLNKDSSSIIDNLEGKVSSRTVENFMYSSALLSIVTGKEYTVPEWEKHEEIDDGQTVIQAILYSMVRYNHGDYSVADLIDVAVGEPVEEVELSAKKALWALRENGLAVVKRDNKWFLAIHADTIRKRLFKNDDDFKGLDISAPLERVAGSEKGIPTAWGKGDQSTRRCVQIPVSCLDQSESNPCNPNVIQM